MTSQTKPINCGTGHCSCIECVVEPSLHKQALDAIRALRQWVQAVPDDTPLPAMPGVDGDWLDDVEQNIKQALAQQEQPAQEPVMYQYRWLNPGDNPDQPESELEWKLV